MVCTRGGMVVHTHPGYVPPYHSRVHTILLPPGLATGAASAPRRAAPRSPGLSMGRMPWAAGLLRARARKSVVSLMSSAPGSLRRSG